MGLVFSYLWSGRTKKVLLLGLDNAGKTSILYKLAIGEVITTVPTVGFNLETITGGGFTLNVWDLGGQATIIPYWRCYYVDVACLIFVIDAADPDRLLPAIEQFKNVVSDPDMLAPYVLILANKQDLFGAIPANDIVQHVSKIIPKTKSWKVIQTSVYKNQGINEGLNWLCDNLRADNANVKKSWLFK